MITSGHLAANRLLARLIDRYEKQFGECLAMSCQNDLSDIDKAIHGAEAGAYETALSDFKDVFNKLNGEM